MNVQPKLAIIDQSQVSIEAISEELRSRLSKIAKLYANVFAEAPWNEFKVCKQEHYTSKQDGFRTQCAICQGDLAPAYPEEEVMRKIISAVGDNKGGFLTVLEDIQGEPLAAGWGFGCSVEKLKTFYRSAEMKTTVEIKVSEYVKNSGVFYIAEVFVDPNFQKRGYGTQIAQALNGRARELELNPVLRTHNSSPMACIAVKTLAMDRIVNLGEDTDYDGRILFAKKLNFK